MRMDMVGPRMAGTQPATTAGGAASAPTTTPAAPPTPASHAPAAVAARLLAGIARRPRQPVVAPTVTGVTAPGPARPGGPRFALQRIASGLDAPVQVTHAPGDDTALYVVQQGGTVVRLDGATRSTFLDVSHSIVSGGEQGLLSIAFHPDYARNGRLYVNYTDANGDTEVVQFHATRGAVDPQSAKVLLTVAQPYPNHNGGQLQFGPDGDLYVGMGDGGSADDPENRAQDPTSRLGKMLRIDVDHPGGGRAYGIPAGNPYARSAGGAHDPKPEIWATGLRNPWRFSFDAKTGDLWIGDVGQDAWEEVDMLPRRAAPGANFGWDVREAAHPHERKAFAPGRVVEPVLQYSHAQGSSVTGGFVYRGKAIPSLQGWYVYADIERAAIRALKVEHGRVVDRRQFPVGEQMMVSFGEDAQHELYVVSLDGTLSKFVPRGAQGPAPVHPAPPQAPAAPVVAVSTIPNRFRFAQSTIHVPAGTVTVRLVNNDGTVHNIGVRDTTPGAPAHPAMGPIVAHGKTSQVTYAFQRGHTYTFFCLPHEGMGMKGTIVVD